MRNFDWLDRAACAGHERPDIFFPGPTNRLTHEARAVCATCPVTAQCSTFQAATGQRRRVGQPARQRQTGQTTGECAAASEKDNAMTAVSHKRNPDHQALIEERRERVAAMTRQGYTASQIAVVLRIAERTVQRYRVQTGCAKPPPVPLTPEELARAEALLEDGCSLSEVARTIGRSHDAVVRRFQGRGWTRQQRAEYLHLVRRMREIA